MVISETVMSTDHKTQKESYCRKIRGFFFFFFFFYYYYLFIYLLSNYQLRSSFTRLLHLHETRNFLCVYVCVCVCACVRACVRMFVCRDCCNINESIKTDTADGAIGSRNYGVKTRLI